MESWERLHRRATVADLHAHPVLKATLLHRDLGRRRKRTLARLFERAFWPLSQRVTFPQMARGGVDVMLSAAYVPEHALVRDLPLARWLLRGMPSVRRALFERDCFSATQDMLDEMEGQIQAYGRALSPPARPVALVRSVGELERALARGAIAVIHAVEGAHSLNGEWGLRHCQEIGVFDARLRDEHLHNVQRLFERGVCYLTLAHFYPNHCAYPVFPYPAYALRFSDWRRLVGGWDMTRGLTTVGESVVERMLELGMLVDITHCTPAARKRIYQIVDHHHKQACVLASHVGVYAVNNELYNLQDWELRWIADHAGVVGVIFMNYWLSPVDSALGLKYLSQTVHHIVQVAGEEVPALGTDFDGFTDPPDEIVDISQLPRLTRYLLAEGRLSEQAMERILGANALALIRRGWGRA